MKNKILATVLMATLLVINGSYAQSGKLKELNNINFFGKKSYNYKSFGKQNVEENLKRAKSDYNYSANARKKKGYKGGNKNNNRRFYQNTEKFFGFSYNDFGRDANFDPVFNRAAQITGLMDDYLKLSRNQEYDMFRLHVLFVSDMMQIEQDGAYAYGNNYNNYGYERELKAEILANYFDALDGILKRSQQNDLDNYFSRHDFMGNRKYGNYNYNNYDRYRDRNYSYGNYDRPRNRDRDRYGRCD